MNSRLLAVAGALVWSTVALNAQVSFDLAGRQVQIHGFASQGFGYSNDNNYLTMKTSEGSFAMTDAGVNASIRLTDKFRIGAQFYDRNVGNLGKWHPQLDWAVADYRFKDWFGVRGGVVKTVFGLYNDTQDMDFLHTFALLPQSLYPTDLRDSLIRHRGGDIYGDISLKHAGGLSYTLFAGHRQDSNYGGYPYLLQPNGGNITDYGGLQYGADLRWNTPLKSLLVGASHMSEDITGTGTWSLAPGTFGVPTTLVIPYSEHSKRDWANQFYSEFTLGNLRVDWEYRRYWRDQITFNDTGEVQTDVRGWYTSAAYRISKRLELGAYYSRFANSWSAFMGEMVLVQSPNQEAPDRHLYDKVVSARVDLSSHWNIKVEGHFMDGYGTPFMYPNGFYTQDNPQGLAPKTNFLLIRTGWNF